jgi:hypothetical protein
LALFLKISQFQEVVVVWLIWMMVRHAKYADAPP